MVKLDAEIIRDTASKYNLIPAVIKAVSIKEAAGSGFYPEFIDAGKKRKHPFAGELIVRFEGHHFRRFTKGKYDISHPELSYKDWKLGNKYNKGVREFGRFFEAFQLDKEAAWLSTSWGMFQIMGFNFKVCGYTSVKEMIIDFYVRGEKAHLEAFLNYCKHFNILRHLRTENFEAFALAYNGKGFKANRYDTELKRLTNFWRNKI